MGKKILSQVQVKISKNSSEKKQLNGLIKVLRPKVYITNSFSFKTLVQQLTGNGTIVPVNDGGNPETSMESSFDGSLESIQVCNDLTLSSEDQMNQAHHPMHFDEMMSEHLFMNIQQEDSVAYGDLDSLLQLDGDSFNVYSQTQQDVSIYDYELSGLI